MAKTAFWATHQAIYRPGAENLAEYSRSCFTIVPLNIRLLFLRLLSIRIKSQEKEKVMPAPTMTPEQHAAALEKARVVRAQRSEFTNKLAMKMITPAEALDQVSDPVIGRMKVKSFVGALPGYGKVKTENLMESLGIPADRRLQGLGAKQMAALKEALSE